MPSLANDDTAYKLFCTDAQHLSEHYFMSLTEQQPLTGRVHKTRTSGMKQTTAVLSLHRHVRSRIMDNNITQQSLTTAGCTGPSYHAYAGGVGGGGGPQ